MTNPRPQSSDEFQRRRLTRAETVGQTLEQLRMQTGLTVSNVAAHLHIREEYVDALEKSDYRKLPSRVFVKNYVRNYAKLLQLNWSAIESLLEEELRVYELEPAIPTLKRHLLMRPLRAAHVAAAVGIIFIVVAIAAYFSFEIANSVQPPTLTLEDVPTTVPADQQSVSIAGQTSPEAIVSINDQEIAVEVDGSFRQVMTLQTGSNVFKVVARTKRSRPNTQYLHIYVEK